MSKSTPLNQLRKNDENLVQDILQEIEKNNGPSNQGNMMMPEMNQPMMELPPMNSVTNTGHNQPPAVSNNVAYVNNTDERRIVSFIPSAMHTTLLVSTIIMVLIHPRMRTLLYSLIPNQSPFLRHKDNLLILFVGVVGGGLFYFSKDFLP